MYILVTSMLVKSTAATKNCSNLDNTNSYSFKHHELHETSGLQAIPSLAFSSKHIQTNKQTNAIQHIHEK